MLKKLQLTLLTTFALSTANAQTNPAITTWLQNNTLTGNYYTVAGGSTVIPNNILVNCQKVEYSTDWVYVSTKGVPAYPTGPFQDGNPSQAQAQNAIFKVSLKPTQHTGTPTATNGGNIGLFINGVALFDYRDGVAWNNATGALCGGPEILLVQVEWVLFKIGIVMQYQLKNLDLIAAKDILLWAIIIIIKIQVRLI